MYIHVHVKHVYIASLLQDLFEMFVVFDYNTLVSSRALETIWNRDSLETDELLMGGRGFIILWAGLRALYTHTHLILFCLNCTMKNNATERECIKIEGRGIQYIFK